MKRILPTESYPPRWPCKCRQQGVGSQASHPPGGRQGERRKRGPGEYEGDAAERNHPLPRRTDSTPASEPDRILKAGNSHDLVEQNGSPIIRQVAEASDKTRKPMACRGVRKRRCRRKTQYCDPTDRTPSFNLPLRSSPMIEIMLSRTRLDGIAGHLMPYRIKISDPRVAQNQDSAPAVRIPRYPPDPPGTWRSILSFPALPAYDRGASNQLQDDLFQRSLDKRN
jgi:hypothetical protein